MEHVRHIELAKMNRSKPEAMCWLTQTELQSPLQRSGVIPLWRLIGARVRFEHALGGRSYRRHCSPSLAHAVSRGAPPDLLEWLW
jgi:hypothetical protein